MKDRAAAPGALAVLGVMLGAMLQAIDGSIVNVAIPKLRDGFGGSLTEVGWVITGYALASLVAMPLAPALAARLGLRRYFAGSVALFVLASAGCALASGLSSLITFRVLQGVASGGLWPLSQGIFMTLYAGERRGTAVALAGVAGVIGPLSGPPLGGLLTDAFGWRSIFWINLPLGALSLWLVLRHLRLPEGEESVRRKGRLDLLGALLLALAVSAMQVGTAHHAWLFAPAAALLVLFVVHVRRSPAPIVDLAVLRHAPLGRTLLAAPLYGACLYSSVFLLPLLLEDQLGASAASAGAVVGIGGIISAAAIVSSQPLLRRFAAGHLCIAGAACFTIAMLLLARVASHGAGDAIFPQALRGLGTGLCYVGMNGFAFATMPGRDTATSASLFYLSRQLGGSLAIALLAAAFDAHGQSASVYGFIALAALAPLSVAPIALARLGRGDKSLTRER